MEGIFFKQRGKINLKNISFTHVEGASGKK